ncbi:DUF1566 domain-containing protein [Draconibacterium orientale]|uniref:Lcl domain-containing protein n=1 Tax=Draconibacterium orientale TaxID=1168034 RepID=UPI0029C0B7C4|nr:DUF1566 domain-containing protein [Draconibacterium orientale]
MRGNTLHNDIRVLILAVLLTVFAVPAYALEGSDTAPGDACTVEDAMRMTANPSGNGGYILTCKGGVWKATFNVATPTEDDQLANKAYVDSQGGMSIQNPDDCDEGESPLYIAATGDWWCPAPCDVPSPTAGTVCDDGSIFAGDTNLYVTDVDQSSSSQWKTSQGTDDIDPDSSTDGQANHDNRSGTLSDFPAFELCENLDRHGHTDWYLPAITEMDVLYTNRIAIGGFSTSNYWSSTESDINRARVKDFDNDLEPLKYKNSTYYVRCVRRN